MADSENTGKKEREQLAALLGDRASYVLLKDESKEPIGRYRLKPGSTPRARRDCIPEEGNYGVIPLKGWFILDLDIHKGDLGKQLKIFETLFGVDFSESIMVETPSGGFHYYLRLPAGFDEPIFNGSLRAYSKHLFEGSGLPVEVIDADIRSSEATGYVVGPGSHVSIGKKGAPYETPGGYKLRGNSRQILKFGGFNGLAEISLGGAELLRHLRQLQLMKRAPLANESEETQRKAREEEPVLMEHAPSSEVIARVSRGLDKKLGSNSEYHRKRAFVLAALRCCYSDYAIAAACVKLDIDRDSYTKERLPFWETLADVKSLRVPARTIHTHYCEVGHADRYRPEQSLEERLAILKHKVETRTLARKQPFRQPRVINMGKALRKLDKGTPKVPQRVRDATLILDTIFQPLCNIGATRIVVAREPVAKTLDMTPSRVAEAMRLLRSSGIVELRNRQRTGLASTYDVAEEYINKYLSGALKYRWSLVKERENRYTTLLYNRFDNSFHELDREKTYRIDGTVKRDWRLELGIPPLIDLDVFAKAYLAKED